MGRWMRQWWRARTYTDGEQICTISVQGWSAGLYTITIDGRVFEFRSPWFEPPRVLEWRQRRRIRKAFPQ